MMTHVSSIADKCIKQEVHWQNNPNGTPRYPAEILCETGRQRITLPEGIYLYFN